MSHDTSKQKDAQSKSSSFGWGRRFATTQIETLNPQLKPPQSSLCCWISASSPRCLVVHHFSFCNTPQKQPVTNQKNLILIFILVSKQTHLVHQGVPLPTASQHEGLLEVHLVACHVLGHGVYPKPNFYRKESLDPMHKSPICFQLFWHFPNLLASLTVVWKVNEVTLLRSISPVFCFLGGWIWSDETFYTRTFGH